MRYCRKDFENHGLMLRCSEYNIQLKDLEKVHLALAILCWLNSNLAIWQGLQRFCTEHKIKLSKVCYSNPLHHGQHTHIHCPVFEFFYILVLYCKMLTCLQNNPSFPRLTISFWHACAQKLQGAFQVLFIKPSSLPSNTISLVCLM